MDEQERDIKIVLVGESNVGKTCLVKQATTGLFEENQTATLGASYASKYITVDDREVHFQIWDTAGTEKYRGMAPMYYHGAQAAVIAFSIADEDSFQKVDVWSESIKENSDAGTLIFLVANKIDLPESERCVSTEAAEIKANNEGFHYMEVSAKSGQGVQDLFQTVAKMVLENPESDQLMAPKSSKLRQETAMDQEKKQKRRNKKC